MIRRKANKTGRSNPDLHFTKLLRTTLETPAWKALSSSAQALYPWLRLEWKGEKSNTNGKLTLSVRQAATRMGCAPNTALKAFHDLQAKGFIRIVEPGCLGVKGLAKSPTYELTEEVNNNVQPPKASMLFRYWKPGRDFPVVEHPKHNPEGRNGTPSQKLARSHLKSCDTGKVKGVPQLSDHLSSCDIRPDRAEKSVAVSKTPLIATPSASKTPPDLLTKIDFGHCTLRGGTLH